MYFLHLNGVRKSPVVPDELSTWLEVSFCDKITRLCCQSFGRAHIGLVVFNTKNGAPLYKG